MLERVLQQTNSTVTTTVFQSTSGASFLGLPVTDWITAISSAIMVAVTIALVYYAHATIEEGKNDRKKSSIEKQLERLYNPLYEFLDILENYRLEHNPEMILIGVSDDNFARTIRVFQNYGQYLDRDTHRKVAQLVSDIVPSQDGKSRFLRVPHIQSCLAPITSKRAELKKELEGLS